MKKKNIFFLFFALSVVLSCYAQKQNDTDKDGVPDSQDVCPFEKGTIANKGCPESNAMQAIKGNYNNALEKLNTYLKTFDDSKSYFQFKVEKDTVFITDNNGLKLYKFHIKDIAGTKIFPVGNTVDIQCTDKQKCIEYINAKYGPSFDTYFYFSIRSENGTNKPFNYAILANLLSNFLFALKKEPIPSTMIYDEGIYLETKTEEEKAIANANTPLEKAVAELAYFLKTVPYGNTYFNQPKLDGTTTLVLNTFKQDMRIYLPNVKSIMLFNPKTLNSKIKIFSNEKRGPCIDINGNSYNTESWASFNSIENAAKFYVLLGNIVEAQHEIYFKGYKTVETYQQKLEFYNAKNIVDIIPENSKVILKGVTKADEHYKDLKKKIGNEFDVISQLELNEDLKTFSGKIYTGRNSYPVTKIEVELIALPAAPTTAEIKKQQQDKESDSLFAVYNKEHFKTITAMSKKTLEANNQLLAKNGFSFIDESIVMAFTDLTNKKAYGQSYKLEQDIVYIFIVTGVGLKEVSVRYSGKTLNTPALGDDPYFAKVTKPLKTEEDGVSQYILTITAKPNFTKGLMIEVYGDFFQYAYIRRYKKK